MAARTDGFVVEVADPRQLEMIFGAMDGLLARTAPFYRMEFRLEGIAPGTFVSGGNAAVRFVTHVPTSLKHGDLWALRITSYNVCYTKLLRAHLISLLHRQESSGTRAALESRHGCASGST